MSKGYAEYQVIEGWGYATQVWNTDKPEAHGGPSAQYTAGDSFRDSQVYGTGLVPKKTLEEFAIISCKEYMRELGIVGPVNKATDPLLELPDPK